MSYYIVSYCFMLLFFLINFFQIAWHSIFILFSVSGRVKLVYGLLRWTVWCITVVQKRKTLYSRWDYTNDLNRLCLVKHSFIPYLSFSFLFFSPVALFSSLSHYSPLTPSHPSHIHLFSFSQYEFHYQEPFTSKEKVAHLRYNSNVFTRWIKIDMKNILA